MQAGANGYLKNDLQPGPKKELMKRVQVAGKQRGKQKDNFYVSVEGRSLEVQRIPGLGDQASELKVGGLEPID